MKIGKQDSSFKLKHLDDGKTVVCSPNGKSLFQLKDKIPFGKYKGTGRTFQNVVDDDPNYIAYLFADKGEDSTFMLSAAQALRNEAERICSAFGKPIHKFYQDEPDQQPKLHIQVSQSTIQSFKQTLENL